MQRETAQAVKERSVMITSLLQRLHLSINGNCFGKKEINRGDEDRGGTQTNSRHKALKITN